MPVFITWILEESIAPFPGQITLTVVIDSWTEEPGTGGGLFLACFDILWWGPPSRPGGKLWEGLLREELWPSSAPAWDRLRPPRACCCCPCCLGLRRGGNRGCGLGSTAAQSGDWKMKRLRLLSGWWASHRRKAERLHSHPRGRLWCLPCGHLSQPQALARAQPSEGNLSEGPRPWPRWVGKLRLRRGHYALHFTGFTAPSHMSPRVICSSPWPDFMCRF